MRTFKCLPNLVTAPDAASSVCWHPGRQWRGPGEFFRWAALGGIERMSRFQELEDFERRFDTMDLDELRKWKKYWTHHAKQLAPKIRKQAMKRVYEIEKAIQLSTQRDAS